MRTEDWEEEEEACGLDTGFDDDVAFDVDGLHVEVEIDGSLADFAVETDVTAPFPFALPAAIRNAAAAVLAVGGIANCLCKYC